MKSCHGQLWTSDLAKMPPPKKNFSWTTEECRFLKGQYTLSNLKWNFAWKTWDFIYGNANLSPSPLLKIKTSHALSWTTWPSDMCMTMSNAHGHLEVQSWSASLDFVRVETTVNYINNTIKTKEQCHILQMRGMPLLNVSLLILSGELKPTRIAD